MPICTSCGEQNPEYTTRCTKCGVSLGAQMRAKQDSIRGRNGNVAKITIWIVILVVLAVVFPTAYKTGNAAYQKYHYESVSNKIIKDCGGPITDTMQAYQKAEVSKCLENSSDYSKAQQDYDAFTKANKP